MAYTSILFKNPNTGMMRTAPVGFSWTVFFFGFFPALFRNDWKGAVIMLLLALITAGISNFVFMFIYNKMYIKSLIGDGYKAASIASGDMSFANAKLGFEVPTLKDKKEGA